MPKVQKSTEYSTTHGPRYFEHNGQWYEIDLYGIYKIDSSLKRRPRKTIISFDDWAPTSSAYDGNGTVYYDWCDSIKSYNVVTGEEKTIARFKHKIKWNEEMEFVAGKTTTTNAPIVWIGVDKYAVYCVTRDGSIGSISLTSNKKIELTSSKKTLKVGEYGYVVPVASTQYLCGDVVRYESSNPNVVYIDEMNVLVARSPGTAKIKVSAYGRSNICTVTVK